MDQYEWINRVRLLICSRSAEQGHRIFSCPRSRLRFRETGSAVPSRVRLLIFHTPAESAAYSQDFVYLYRQPPSGQSRVYQVTQLRTDGVYCREYDGSEASEVLEVVPVTGAAFSGITLGPIDARLSFPTPTMNIIIGT